MSPAPAEIREPENLLKFTATTSLGKTADQAESGADRKVRFQAHIPEDLQAVVDAWPALPEHIRAAVRALVKTGA